MYKAQQTLWIGSRSVCCSEVGSLMVSPKFDTLCPTMYIYFVECSELWYQHTVGSSLWGSLSNTHIALLFASGHFPFHSELSLTKTFSLSTLALGCACMFASKGTFLIVLLSWFKPHADFVSYECQMKQYPWSYVHNFLKYRSSVQLNWNPFNKTSKKNKNQESIGYLVI